MKSSSATAFILSFALMLTLGCASTHQTRKAADPSASRIDPMADVASDNVQPIDEHESTPSAIRLVTHQELSIAPEPGDSFEESAVATDEVEIVANANNSMTLAAFEELAMHNNPAICQAAAAARQAAGVHAQVGLKPNPSVGYFGDEFGNDSTSGLQGAYMTQAIVRGKKLAWNRTVLGHDVDTYRWLTEAQRYRVQTDVRVKFYEALGAQKRLELARQFRGVAEAGVDVSKELLRVREGARPDVLQSEVQLSEVDLMIQQARFEFDAAWNELAAIVGMPTLAPTVLVGDLSLPKTDRDIEGVYAQMLAESPVLSAACAQVRRARANLQRQRVQAIPNVNAQLGAGYDDGTGDEFANVQISMPIPVHNKNQGNIQAAYAQYSAATQNVRRLKLQMRRNLAQSMRAYEIAKATVQQYEESILPRVSESLDLVQNAHALGEFEFLRVLTARRAFFDANFKYVTAQAELAQANSAIDGLLLTGGLDQSITYSGGDDLRGAALSGQ
ncbi:MAG: TolC family protein [Planctomycetales bacterium]|nr:TolC family protein [Planctomycetales bacterium]